MAGFERRLFAAEAANGMREIKNRGYLLRMLVIGARRSLIYEVVG
jgi:hypothetical protein